MMGKILELAASAADKVKLTEQSMSLNVKPGAADSSIYNMENGNCIADDMARAGVSWLHANKSPGSRVNGWEIMRRMLKGSSSSEEPGLYVFNTCRQFCRTIPTLPRDKKKTDDVDTNAEDHLADEVRYRLLSKREFMNVARVGGLRG